MDSYQVERLVHGEPSAVRASIAALVAALWGDRSRIVLDDRADERIDAIGAGAGADEADVWLTWELSREAGGTRVRLRLDELESGPDPGDALIDLLEAVAARAIGSSRAVGGSS